jgi:hypothetical protein
MPNNRTLRRVARYTVNHIELGGMPQSFRRWAWCSTGNSQRSVVPIVPDLKKNAHPNKMRGVEVESCGQTQFSLCRYVDCTATERVP